MLITEFNSNFPLTGRFLHPAALNCGFLGDRPYPCHLNVPDRCLPSEHAVGCNPLRSGHPVFGQNPRGDGHRDWGPCGRSRSSLVPHGQHRIPPLLAAHLQRHCSGLHRYEHAAPNVVGDRSVPAQKFRRPCRTCFRLGVFLAMGRAVGTSRSDSQDCHFRGSRKVDDVSLAPHFQWKELDDSFFFAIALPIGVNITLTECWRL